MVVGVVLIVEEEALEEELAESSCVRGVEPDGRDKAGEEVLEDSGLRAPDADAEDPRFVGCQLQPRPARAKEGQRKSGTSLPPSDKSRRSWTSLMGCAPTAAPPCAPTRAARAASAPAKGAASTLR